MVATPEFKHLAWLFPYIKTRNTISSLDTRRKPRQPLEERNDGNTFITIISLCSYYTKLKLKNSLISVLSMALVRSCAACIRFPLLSLLGVDVHL